MDRYKQIEQKIRKCLSSENQGKVKKALDQLRPEDISWSLSRFSKNECIAIFSALDNQKAAEVLVELPTQIAKTHVDEVPDSVLINYLKVLPTDDIISLKEEVSEERFETLLDQLPPDESRFIRKLITYPEGSIGRYITSNFVKADREMSLGRIMNQIQEAPENEFETVNIVFVLGSHGHLIGIIPLRRLLRHHYKTKAEEVMITEVIVARYDESKESAARLLSRYGFASLPIVDERGKMLGILTSDDAQTILDSEDTEDVLKLGGVSGIPETYLSNSIFQIAKKRLPWLFILFIAETLTGAVLRYYGQSGLGITPVVYFIPLLVGAGGNTGSQTTTTITRALALGELHHNDFLLVMKKELSIASLIGLFLGVASYGRALLWGADPRLCLVVGIAMPCIVLWASFISSMLPLGAKKVGIDPAVMSAPFITTFVDSTGLIIYLELVRNMVK